jgi:CysZ protein
VNDALAKRRVAALAVPRERPGFVAGASALFGGFGFVLTNPSIWPLAMVPVVVASALTAGVSYALLHPLMPAIAGLFGPKLGLLAAIVQILVAALAFLVAAMIGFGLAQPLSGPALNRIVRRAEADLGAPPWPASGLAEDVGRALHSLAIAYGVGLPILAALSLVTFFVPPASVVTFPLKLIVLALLIAWDLCDYPLSVHGVPVGARVSFAARNLSALLGFGLGLGLLSLVPCLMVLVLPAGVAGAARLTRRIELFEATAKR